MSGSSLKRCSQCENWCRVGKTTVGKCEVRQMFRDASAYPCEHAVERASKKKG